MTIQTSKPTKYVTRDHKFSQVILIASCFCSEQTYPFNFLQYSIFLVLEMQRNVKTGGRATILLLVIINLNIEMIGLNFGPR